MIKKLFNFPAFLISLAIGLLFVYLNEVDRKIVHIYPTKSNINDIEYKDSVGNCFAFSMASVDCPIDKNKIKTIPIQSI